eukprot:Seg4787.1 transcript_id=Seg4787.1/GoldUCD/mRNA.D3Y31 product="Zinc finger protein 18" protein_id=Seg4787.1/GoldUCD/D3Y31
MAANQNKSVKFSGYHAFYKSATKQIKDSIPDANLATMSKTAAGMWKLCSLDVRKDWKKEGQRMREEIDCGTCVYKCKQCTITFARAKDAVYHEKNCGNCICQTCKSTFPNQLALRKHLYIHKEIYKCEICQKSFQTRNNGATSENYNEKGRCFRKDSKSKQSGHKDNENKKYKYDQIDWR